MSPRIGPWIAAALLLLAGTPGCSTQQRRAWLTFFFEGVPPPEGETPPGGTPPPEATPPAGGPAPAPASVAPVTTWKLHAPFREHKCSACHASNLSQSLKGPQKEFCTPCHQKVMTGKEVLHWPLRKGRCTVCHEPHRSTNDKLLKKPGAALCADCHPPPKKKFVHEPVRRGRCQSCHTAHESDFRGLLTKDGDAVCLRCHEAEPMKALPAHAGAGDRACVQCHDAHQSDNRGLLK